MTRNCLLYHILPQNPVDFLKNELQVASYITSYELLFPCELRVIVYCTGCGLLFACELRVTVYCSMGCNCHFICESRSFLICFKGATKFYFAHYSFLVIILFCFIQKLCIFSRFFWETRFLSFCAFYVVSNQGRLIRRNEFS